MGVVLVYLRSDFDNLNLIDFFEYNSIREKREYLEYCAKYYPEIAYKYVISENK